MGGLFKEGGIRTVTAARQEARAELDTHPPTPTSIHTHPHPTRPTPTPAHTHPQTMFFQLNYCFFSCIGRGIPPSLDEPHTHPYIYVYKYIGTFIYVWSFIYTYTYKCSDLQRQLFNCFPHCLSSGSGVRKGSPNIKRLKKNVFKAFQVASPF